MPSSWPAVSALVLLPAAVSAVTLDCKHIRVDKQSFDLSPLTGPKTVHWQQWLPPKIHNTTFTIDICQSLKKDKNLPQDEQCMTGTRVCAIERLFDSTNSEGEIEKVIPIAGDFYASHGRTLDAEVTRLKNSASNSDADKEGLLVQLHGGKYPETRQGRLQKAILELQCDRDWTGNEGFEEDTKKLDGSGFVTIRNTTPEDEPDDSGPELPDLDQGKALQFQSFKPETDGVGVLRLTWKTKYACEGAFDEPKEDRDKNTQGWGLFTWFLIILFLLAASYIILGSWLNYNRYGARGWDLIPHGDTIRDIPYIVKEFAGNMIDRVKGGDSRGGYSAV